jgi:hypothetical protein
VEKHNPGVSNHLPLKNNASCGSIQRSKVNFNEIINLNFFISRCQQIKRFLIKEETAELSQGYALLIIGRKKSKRKLFSENTLSMTLT